MRGLLLMQVLRLGQGLEILLEGLVSSLRLACLPLVRNLMLSRLLRFWIQRVSTWSLLFLETTVYGNTYIYTHIYT
jgi:hypothetical protein